MKSRPRKPPEKDRRDRGPPPEQWTASVDSCVEVKSALQLRNYIWQSLEEGAGKRCSECDQYPNLSEGADRVGGQLRRILVLIYNCGSSLAPKHPRKHETHPPRVKKRERKEEESVATLQAPLSGIFLQTLPDLVTPLKGHSLSPRSCPPTPSAPSDRFGY